MAWKRGLLALLLGGCTAASRPWSGVDSFACQLQNLKTEEVRASSFDLVIIDFLDRAQLQALRPGRLVVAYLSIGEAENYRPYWQPAWKPGKPAWLGPQNPDWGGNFQVRYWDPGWQALVEKALDQIVASGFDGVFLDRVDAFELHPDRSTAPTEMSALVQRLAQRARQRAGPDFGVFPNNGEALLSDPAYLACITGIVKESIFYGEPRDSVATPAASTKSAQQALLPAVRAGKLVLSIDYTTQPSQIASARQRARQAGYLEYIAPRQLDSLGGQPGGKEKNSR